MVRSYGNSSTDWTYESVKTRIAFAVGFAFGVVFVLVYQKLRAKVGQGDRTTFIPNSPEEIRKAISGSGASRVSLHRTLTDFLTMKIGLFGNEQQVVLQLAHRIAVSLSTKLQQRTDMFTFLKPKLIGSSSDGTMLQSKGNCDYILPIKVRPHIGYWHYIEDHVGDGSWRLRVKYPPEEMKAFTITVKNSGFIFDSHDHYLSPSKIDVFLREKVTEVIQEKLLDVVSVNLVSHQQQHVAWKFEVKYRLRDDKGYHTFDMNFVPCVLVGILNASFVGLRHPRLHHDNPGESNLADVLWLKSYSKEESNLIASGRDWSKQVYRIVKYLRYHHPQFSPFSSFIYKNVFIYLLEQHPSPDQWSEFCVSDRFMDFMKYLAECVKKGELNHYFLQNRRGILRNLFKSDYEMEQLTEFYNFLHHNNQEGKQAWVKIFEDMI